ncbi:hypothetical protein OJAV_G00161450 [Oryzias javanicus]|uniref:Ig-like domain-containing protein n=1 Tax=Oryzias javanicus TaxID=123683 RepID=A0A3S2LWM2_ORYJA|nr:hypothetical protein OJAV_G00161450 [Oryzias javanicus]
MLTKIKELHKSTMKILIQHLIILIFMSKEAGAEEIITAMVGEDVTLRISKPSTDVYLFWNKDGSKIASANNLGGKFVEDTSLKAKLTVGDNFLLIRSIGANDFGIFECQIKDSSNRPRERIVFNVIKLKVGRNPTGPVLPWMETTLTCEVETPRTEIQTRWKTPQGEFILKATHVIKAISQNSGQWTCVANNKKVSISVPVVAFTPAPPHHYTSENSQLLVPFSFSFGIRLDDIKNVTTKIEWFFTPKTSSVAKKLFSLSMTKSLKPEVDHERNLKLSDVNKGNFSLWRHQGQKSDAGSYTCSITFTNEKTLKATTKFEVLQIIPSPGAHLTSGQQLKLSCTTGEHLPPDMQLKWVLPKTSPQLLTDQHSANLTFPEVSTDDSGNWRCELWQNNTSLVSTVITLQIEPILNTWQLVVMCVAGVILLVLLILIIIRCRRHKQRRLRHQFCRCKNPQPKGFYRT